MAYGVIYGKFQMKEEQPSYDDMLKITKTYGAVVFDFNPDYDQDAMVRDTARCSYYTALHDSRGLVVCNNVSVHKASGVVKMYTRLKDIIMTECMLVSGKI